MSADTAATGLRWIARVSSVAALLVLLAFAVGELKETAAPRAQEWVGLSLWPVGVCAGMALGWIRERAGGLLCMVCLVAFYVWNLATNGKLPRGPFFVLLAAPGILFWIAGWLSARSTAKRS